MMKRAGRAHDPLGVDGTKCGELAVVCPACPHPGINLPDDWKDAPDGEKYVLILICPRESLIEYHNFLGSCIVYTCPWTRVFA